MQNRTAPAKRFKPLVFTVIMLIHAGALLALHPYFFSWGGVALFAFLTWATASLGVSLCNHRLLAHKSWEPVPWLRTVLVFCSSISLQSGPITWAATHRLHHRESDHEDDPHSPLQNFLWSHLLWNFYTVPAMEDKALVRRLAPDLVDDPLLKWLERYFFVVWMIVALLSFGAGYLIAGGGAPGLQLGLSLVVWGSLLRTTTVWHSTWFVNSVTHLFGYRNYNTADDSRNLWWVSVLTFGEGWHNNHHAIAGSAKLGRHWWEIDTTWWALVVFKLFGWARRVTVAPLPGTEAAGRSFSGKTGARSAKLLRRSDRTALQLAQELEYSPVALAGALRSRKRHIRQTAALAIGHLGESARDAIDPLIRALADESSRVRRAALEALVRIGDSAVPALEHAAQNAEAALARMWVQRALRLIGAPAPVRR